MTWTADTGVAAGYGTYDIYQQRFDSDGNLLTPKDDAVFHTIDGSGGAETLSGGNNDDIFVVPDTLFAGIHGKAGVDTLKLDGTGLHLDFASDAIASGVVTGIEHIDITGTGGNTLSVTAQDVLDMSDTTNLLIVHGDRGDTLNASGFTAGGSVTSNGETFDVFTSGSATLWVEQDLGTVNVV
ncbi:hypothetical protein [Ensifer sp. SL37]|uniref:hypothetical protein n=1 Tax=Ensifer sp. SL37 TaxID=2995137 RepID=UPI002272FA5D|nr:hypothetical protein [Ensifer sp. SL37]MCY1740524.1 hypothetical protein [Ensifer sp. SL37]